MNDYTYNLHISVVINNTGIRNFYYDIHHLQQITTTCKIIVHHSCINAVFFELWVAVIFQIVYKIDRYMMNRSVSEKN